MANSFTGINETIMVKECVPAFKAALTPISGFSTDYSAEAKRKGEKISVPVATARTAASRADGATYLVDTGNTVATVDVTLNQQYHVPWYVTDGTDAKTTVKLWENGLREGVAGLALAIYQSLLGVFVKATYGDVDGTSKQIVAASAYDLDDLIDLDTMLAKRNAVGPRTLITTLSYGNALKKDNAIQDASAFGSDSVVRTGRFGVPIYGITAYETNAFPAGITGGSELTGGILAVPSAAAIAVRPVEPMDSTGMSFEIGTDDETGISFGYRRWYEKGTGTMWGTVEACWGVIAVQSSGAVRICTA